MLRLFSTSMAWVFLASYAAGAVLEEPRIESVLESGPAEECIDVLFVGDGYTAEDLENGKYAEDVERFSSQLLEELPFDWFDDRFNVRALYLESEESGCDPDPNRDHATTALESHFDHWRGRILRFRREALLTELVRGAGGVDMVFVMVNTSRYGGSGSVLHSYRPHGAPCPAPVFSARHPEGFAVAVHELGHSFANLTDEYADPRMQSEYRLPWGGRDVDHPNATRAGFFDDSSLTALRDSIKWGRFLDLPGAQAHAWVHEGSYYRDAGVFRPWPRCKMRKREDPFCPVCAEAIAQALAKVCGLEWDPAAYHRDHPLARWEPVAPPPRPLSESER